MYVNLSLVVEKVRKLEGFFFFFFLVKCNKGIFGNSIFLKWTQLVVWAQGQVSYFSVGFNSNLDGRGYYRVIESNRG